MYQIEFCHDIIILCLFSLQSPVKTNDLIQSVIKEMQHQDVSCALDVMSGLTSPTNCNKVACHCFPQNPRMHYSTRRCNFQDIMVFSGLHSLPYYTSFNYLLLFLDVLLLQ